jgi:hypothetical protein
LPSEMIDGQRAISRMNIIRVSLMTLRARGAPRAPTSDPISARRVDPSKRVVRELRSSCRARAQSGAVICASCRPSTARGSTIIALRLCVGEVKFLIGPGGIPQRGDRRAALAHAGQASRAQRELRLHVAIRLSALEQASQDITINPANLAAELPDLPQSRGNVAPLPATCSRRQRPARLQNHGNGSTAGRHRGARCDITQGHSPHPTLRKAGKTRA